MNSGARNGRQPADDLEGQVVLAYQALDRVSSALANIARQSVRAFETSDPAERERAATLAVSHAANVARTALEATGDVAAALANIAGGLGRIRSAARDDGDEQEGRGQKRDR